MLCSLSNSSLMRRHRCASPMINGRIWLGVSASGRSAFSSLAFSRATLFCWRVRCSGCALRCRTAASAPAARCGQSDVVKMKLSEELRVTSISRGGPGTIANPLLLGHAGAPGAIEADGMDLVEIGDGAVLLRDIADGGDRSNIAVHAVDALERHDLGTVRRGGVQQLIEMSGIVMSEDKALGARPADAFDHRIVVERVREDRAARQELTQRAECGEVGDPARC